MAHTNASTLTLLERVSADTESEYHKIFREICKRHKQSVPKSLLREIREDGTNTFVNIFSEPVSYGEVVRRAAKKIGITEGLTDNLETNELLIISKITKDYLEGLSEEERQSLHETLKSVADELGGVSVKEALIRDGLLCGNLGMGLLALLIKELGTRVVQQLLMRILLNVTGRMALQQMARTIAGTLIPFLNVVMAAWLVSDVAGPAYRKIVPTVINIAMLRMFYAIH